MTDIKLTVGAKDTGAKKLIEAISLALGKLSEEQLRGMGVSVKQTTVQEKLAQAERNSANAIRAKTRTISQQIEIARQQTNAYREQAQALRQQTQGIVVSASQQAKAQQQATQAAIEGGRQASKAASDATRAINLQTQAQTIAASASAKALQQQTQAQIQSARVYNGALATQSKALQQQTQAQINAAAAAGRAVNLQTQAMVQSLGQQTRAIQQATQERINAQRQAAQATRQQTQAINEQTRSAIASAKAQQQATNAQTRAINQQTTAVVRNANQQIAAQLAVSRATQQAASNAANASRQQSAAAIAAARVQAAQIQATAAVQVANIRAQQQAAQAARQHVATQRSMIASTHTNATAVHLLTRRLIALAGVLSGARMFRAFTREGFQFNEVLENATLGIASLITAQSQLRDSQGNLQTGATALNTAMALSERQMIQLRIAGLQTAATTEQLVTAFQQGVGPGLRAGLALDDIRKLTVSITQAAGAIALPMHQLNEEVRSLLSGTITYNTRIAKTLGITNEMVANWKEQGVLAERLLERFNAFNVAGERALQNMTVLKSNIAEAFQVFAGAATKPLFEELKSAGLEALDSMFDFDQAQINAAFAGLVNVARDIFTSIGAMLGDAIRGAAAAAQRLSDYFNENRAAIQGVISSAEDLTREFSRFLGEIFKTVAGLIDIGVRSGFIEAVFRTLTGLTRIVANNIVLIRDALAAAVIYKGILAIASLASLGPVGGAILAVAAALGVLAVALSNTADESERLARQKAIDDNEDRNRAVAIARLSAEYDTLRAAMKSGKMSAAELTEAQKKLDNITRQVTNFAPEFAKQISHWGTTADQTAAAMRRLEQAQVALIRRQFDVAQSDKAALQLQRERTAANLRSIEASQKNLRDGGDERGAKKLEKNAQDAKDALQALDNQLVVAQDNVNTTLNAMANLLGNDDQVRRPVTVTPNEFGDEEDSAKARRDKANNDFKQAIEAQIRTVKDIFSRTKDQLDASLADQQISFKAYVDGIVAAEELALRAEIELRTKLRAGITDVGEQRQETETIKSLNARREELGAEGARRLLDLERDLSEKVEQLTIQRLRNEGKLGEARRLEVEEQYREIKATIAAQGRDTTFIDNLINVEVARARMEEVQAIVSRAQDLLTSRMSEIDNLREQGQLTSREQAEQTGNAYRAAIAQIERSLPALREFAKIAGNPEAAQGVRDLEAEVVRLGQQLRIATDHWYRFGTAARRGLEDSLTEVFANLGTEITRLDEALLLVANSIIQNLQRETAQYLAQTITATMTRAFTTASKEIAESFVGSLVRNVGRALRGAFDATIGRALAGVGAALGIEAEAKVLPSVLDSEAVKQQTTAAIDATLSTSQDTAAATTQQSAAVTQQTAALTMQTAATTFSTAVASLAGAIPALAAAKGGEAVVSAVGNATVETAVATTAETVTEGAAATALTGAAGLLSGAATLLGAPSVALNASALALTGAAGVMAGALVSPAIALQSAAFSMQGAAGSLLGAAAALSTSAGSTTFSNFVPRFASGGPAPTNGAIPQSGRRDPLRIDVEGGEFVHTTLAHRYYGTQVMNALNQRLVSREALLAAVKASASPASVATPRQGRYASGGPVTHVVRNFNAPVTQTPNTPKSSRTRLLVGLQDGLVERRMESEAGERAIVKTIARNRSKFSGLL